MKHKSNSILNVTLFMILLVSCSQKATPTVTISPTLQASSTATLEPTPAVTSTGMLPVPGDMLLISAGNFQMGCDPDHNDHYSPCYADELPLHTVFLPDYLIDKYEVTNAEYARCVGDGSCTPPAQVSSVSRTLYYDNPAYANYPVVYVSWYQAHNYCTWMGKRLPAEAEWEKAARGSSDTRAYPWGDQTPDCTYANYWLNPGIAGCIEDTSEVGSYDNGASPYGVMDLAGNVWEWVEDWYDASYYSISESSFPLGPFSGTTKVQRGGDWGVDPYALRVAHRFAYPPDSVFNSVGFRCAADALLPAASPSSPSSTLLISPSATPSPTSTPQPSATSSPTRMASFIPTLVPSDWEKLSIQAPSAQRGAQAVYDPSRGVIVMFGGEANGSYFNETWEFDGETWEQVKTTASPAARIWHGMAYDSQRKVVVLFGGTNSSGSGLNDTWEYNGTNWQKITTEHSPGKRGYGPGMTFDTCRNRVVLFGGSDPSTCKYDGTDWICSSSGTQPSQRGLTSMVFDSTRCRAVLFGGNGTGTSDDTWEYDGTIWEKIATATHPDARWAHAMAFDPLTGRIVLFGGYSPAISNPRGDTWYYEDQTWTKVSIPEAPSKREQHWLVFDGSRVILYGGFGSNETWRLIEPPSATNCAAGWSRLEWGDYAVVTPGDLPNRVRSAPNTSPDNIISTLYPGAIVHIIEGPWCNNGLVFWKVENDTIPGGSGWTAEGDGTEYYLEPYQP